MAAGLAIGLVPGATVGGQGRGATIRADTRVVRLGRECPRWVIAAITSAHRDERALAEDALARRGLVGLQALYTGLAFLRSHRLLGYSVTVGGKPFVTWIPDAADDHAGERARPRGQRVALSCFAYCHRGEHAMILESPLAHGQVVLHGDAAWRAIGQLTRPRSREDALAALDVPPTAARQLLALLWRRRFLTESPGTTGGRDDEGGPLGAWEFHDLLFHTRSRHGRHRNGYGARPRAWSPLRPDLPAARPGPADIVPLPRPDLDRLRRTEQPFTAVVEDRRTDRAQAASAMSVQQLGEFLYRSARARRRPSPERRKPAAWFDRVAPTGGAAFELDVYVAVRRCRGVRPGLYRYDPFGHALWRRAAMTREVTRLLSSAGHAARTTPQILIIVSARFGRTLRRYASMGYAMILKDAGVLFQTFYLVATAMELAPCAIGGGDADDFARAARTNYYEETSVGEFLLGASKRSNAVPRGVPKPVHGSQPRRRAR